MEGGGRMIRVALFGEVADLGMTGLEGLIGVRVVGVDVVGW